MPCAHHGGPLETGGTRVVQEVNQIEHSGFSVVTALFMFGDLCVVVEYDAEDGLDDESEDTLAKACDAPWMGWTTRPEYFSLTQDLWMSRLANHWSG